jgi:hypothetical protein
MIRSRDQCGAEWADELGERRDPNDTGGSELGTATQFDLCESGRIIRDSKSRSAYGTLSLPKLCPPNRRALFFDDDNGTADVRFVRGMVKSLK